MKTMPRTTLKLMRFVVEFLMTAIAWWEDHHAGPNHDEDYRMTHLNTGLWQASDSIKQILDGEFVPLQQGARLVEMPEVELGQHYVAQYISSVPVGLYPADSVD